MYPPLHHIPSKGVCNATPIMFEMTMIFDRGFTVKNLMVISTYLSVKFGASSSHMD